MYRRITIIINHNNLRPPASFYSAEEFNELHMTPTIAYPSADRLGEGPLWSVKEQALYWIDIKRPSIQKWTPSTKDYQVWVLPTDIGSFALRKQGGAILAMRDGFHFFDFETGEQSPFVDPEASLPDNRFNDGKCDPNGNFWAGTLHDQENIPEAALYRLHPDGTWRLIKSGIIVSNGLGWSPDHRTMYYTDSGTQCIYAYDFDASNSEISNERILVRDTDCYPDGLTVDSEGYIWSAKWDGWRVVRYSPNGKIDRVLEMPVQRPTSVMFGGPDLDRLFITSAWDRLSKEAKAKQPHAGHVFVADVGVSGLPETDFAG